MNTPPFPRLLTAPVKVALNNVVLLPAMPSGAVKVTLNVKVLPVYVAAVVADKAPGCDGWCGAIGCHPDQKAPTVCWKMLS